MKRVTKQFSQKMARRIMLRDNGTCVYCSGIATQIDHVVPHSKDGPSTVANGVACCTHCNMKKKGKLSEEYLVKGLVHLVRAGEDIDWVDTLYTNRLAQLTQAQELAIRLLTEGGLTRSEVCIILGIKEETIASYEETL